MTVIVKSERGPEPPQTKAGYLWPGLGHLLVGEFVHGVGMMTLTFVVVGSVFLGLPQTSGTSLADGALLGKVVIALGALGLSVLVRITIRSRGDTPIIKALFARAILLLPCGALVIVGTLLQAIPMPAVSFDLHTLIAIPTIPVAAGLLWYRAHRRAFPIELTEEQYNNNNEVFARMMRRHTTGMVGMYGALFLLLVTLLTPFIAPFDPDVIDVGPPIFAPGWWQHLTAMLGWREDAAVGFFEYPMGTDEHGRDGFSRLLYGSRISLFIGFIAVSIAATIGTSVGAAAGYFGGWVDRSLMWFVDFLLAMPRLILLLAVVGIINVGGVWRLFLIILILGFTGWMSVARIVRSQVLSLKEQDFIQAAHALGYSSTRIVFRHLIPNAMAPVIIYCSLAIGGTMLTEAALSFLGLGVPPPTSTWGVLVNEGRDTLRNAPWISVFPGLAIVMAVMCFNLIGDGLRDALDPKQRT